MKLEAYTDTLSGATRLRDVATKQCFGRVVAGLAWPKGTTPGAVVALAEDVAGDAVDGIRVLRLCGWEQHANVERLLELASDVAPLAGDRAGRSAVGVFVGDPWHPFAKRLRPINDRLTAENRPRIHLRPAPGDGGWSLVADWAPYYDARTVGRKALILREPKLLAMVEDAGRDIRRAIADFPSVAALLWAIAYCDERKPAVGRTETRSGAADNAAGY
jgi:hypothetical protein